MRTKRGVISEHLVAPAIIIFLLILVFAILILGQPRSEMYNLVPGSKGEPYESTIFSKLPGQLGGDVKSGKTESLSFNINPITLDKSVTSSTEPLSNSLSVRRSFFEDQPEVINFNAESTRGSKLYFTVLSKTGDGDLIINLNGNTIFSEKIQSGITRKIALPGLKEGSNELKIYTTSPSFWGTNSYTLSDIEFTAMGVEETSRIIRTFEINNTVFSSANKAKFSASFIKLPKLAEGTVIIELNNHEIYDHTPASTDKISFDAPASYLTEGVNSLAFSVEEGSGYEVMIPKISVVYAPMHEKSKQYEFVISDADWAHVSQPLKYKCVLHIDKSSGGDILTVDLNGYTYRPNLITSKSWEDDVCRRLVKGENELIVSADDKIGVASISLTVTNER